MIYIIYILGTLIYHQEYPDKWTKSEILELKRSCKVGDCNGRKGNSFFNFDALSGNGPFCFRFEWGDGSKFSWCQHLNPVEHQGAVRNLTTALSDFRHQHILQPTRSKISPNSNLGLFENSFLKNAILEFLSNLLTIFI